MNKDFHLSDLKKGQKCVVLDIHNSNSVLRRRLLDLGITKGTAIEMVDVAPLGSDPVIIFLRGYQLCIRRAEAKEIDVKIL